MIWSIAWKNVWRNHKRSLIVIVAVLLGTAAGVFTSGLMVGWVDQRIRSLVHVEVGHIKLHNPEYLNNEEIGHLIADVPAVTQSLSTNPAVKGFSPRIKVMAMASTSRGNTALNVQGIDIKQEKTVSELYTHVLPGGSYLKDTDENTILISDKTAEQLRIKNYTLKESTFDSLQNQSVPQPVIDQLRTLENVRFNTEKAFKKAVAEVLTEKQIANYGAAIVTTAKHYRLRSKIVFTFTDAYGEMVSQSFRVSGVYKTDNLVFDQTNAFVRKDELARLTGLSATDCHEIGIVLYDEEQVKPTQDALKQAFPALSVMNWLEISPDAGMLTQYMDLYYYILMGFIMFALAFGIINTMLMAILERTKELGMLMAIGMSRMRIFYMIMLETIFLTLVGAVLGMAVGWLVINITGHTGLDFSVVGEGFEAMGWSAVVYPSITPDFFFGVTLLVIATGILSSILPARKALSLIPVDAIKSDN